MYHTGSEGITTQNLDGQHLKWELTTKTDISFHAEALLRGSSGENSLQINYPEQNMRYEVEWCHTAASQTSVHADFISEIEFFCLVPK